MEGLLGMARPILLEARAPESNLRVSFMATLRYTRNSTMDMHRDTLFENLLNLYIRRSVLNGKKSFYSSVYSGEDLRDKQKLSLLEELMKTVLLKVIRMLGMPISFEHENEMEVGAINLRIHEQAPLCLDSFYSKRFLARICEYETYGKSAIK